VRYRRTRRDANHAEIVAGLQRVGCSVEDLAAVGGGCPDVLVGYTCSRGFHWTVLLEIKNPARKTRGDNAAKTLEKQRKWREAWKGTPVKVVDSLYAAQLAVHPEIVEVQVHAA